MLCALIYVLFINRVSLHTVPGVTGVGL